MLTEWRRTRINHGETLRDKSSQVAVKLGAYDSGRGGGVGRAEVARRVVPSIAGSRRLAGRRPVPRIFIGCKGRHLRSIKTLVSGAPARAPPARRNRALHTLLRDHYPFYPDDFQGRLLARVRRPANCTLGVERARQRLLRFTGYAPR